MADKNLAFRISANPDDAVKGFDKVARAAKRSMSDTEEALDDSRTEAQKLADAVGSLADEMTSEFDRGKQAADELANALGPEFRAKLSQADVDKFVNDLRRAGLTFEQIEADADSLAAAIKKMDGAMSSIDGPRRFDDFGTSARRASDDVDGMTRSAGGANSALANMVGNSAQDIGALSGVAGSAGVAIGQMAEYASDAALDGEKLGSSLKSMARVAGPIAALSAVTLVAGKMIGDAGKRAEAAREQVDGFVEAIVDGGGALEQFRDEIERTNRLDLVSLFGETADFLPVLDEAGVSLEQFSDAVEGGEPALAELERAMRDAGVEGNTIAFIMNAARTAADDYAESQERARIVTDALAGSAEGAAPAIEALTGAVTGSAEAAEVLAPALDAVAGAAGGAATEIDAAGEALEQSAEHARTLNQATYDLEQRWAALLGVLDERDALRNLEEGFDEVNAAAVEAYTANTTGAENAQEATRAQEQSVDDLKREIIEYGREVLGLPPQQVTEILAMLDRGEFEAAKALLAELSRERRVNLRIVATGDVGVFRSVSSNSSRNGSIRQNAMASGGTGPGLAGETGQLEFVGRGMVGSPTLIGAGERVTGVKDTAALVRDMIESNSRLAAAIARGGSGVDSAAIAAATAAGVERAGRQLINTMMAGRRH